MLINLVSLSNYQSYNVVIAQTLGLNTAVYLNALIEINEKAIRKNKLVNEHFLINRKYITERTTLSISQQKSIEKLLIENHIIDMKSDDCIKVNIDVLYGIMMGEDESILKDLTFIRQNKEDTKNDIKSQTILKAVKNNINKEYPEDMQEAYSEWLDVIQHKFKFVSKQMILNAQKIVDEAANHDVDKAIDIIHIASANGWKEMKYAVKVYNKNHQQKLSNVKQNDIHVSTELF